MFLTEIIAVKFAIGSFVISATLQDQQGAVRSQHLLMLCALPLLAAAGTYWTIGRARTALGRMRTKIPALDHALTGSFGEHHSFLCRMHLTRIDELSATIEELWARIDQEMRPFAPQIEHLVTIPGVKKKTAQVIIAETSADMTRFATPANLASWAGFCPGHHESAGRQHSGRRRHGNR